MTTNSTFNFTLIACISNLKQRYCCVLRFCCVSVVLWVTVCHLWKRYCRKVKWKWQARGLCNVYLGLLTKRRCKHVWNMFGTILLDFPTCHLNSCNFGQHRNLIFLGKQSQEFPEKSSRFVINCFLTKLLVSYGSLFPLTCATHLLAIQATNVVSSSLSNRNYCTLRFWSSMSDFCTNFNVITSLWSTRDINEQC